MPLAKAGTHSQPITKHGNHNQRVSSERPVDPPIPKPSRETKESTRVERSTMVAHVMDVPVAADHASLLQLNQSKISRLH